MSKRGGGDCNHPCDFSWSGTSGGGREPGGKLPLTREYMSCHAGTHIWRGLYLLLSWSIVRPGGAADFGADLAAWAI